MKNESELKMKRAYWSGVYYALDPAERIGSEKSGRLWLTAEIWLNVIDWALGQVTDTAAKLGPKDDNGIEWET
jgi:hypothetical protein